MPRLDATNPLRCLAAALIGGVALALCLPKPGLCFLAWFSLAPLLGACLQSPPLKAAGLGFLAGFAFHGTAFYWVYNTARFAGVAVPVATAALMCLAAFLAVNWALIAGLSRALDQKRSAALRPWIWACVWTAVAAVSERWTPRLSGDLLGYTQYRHLSLLQISSIVGPHGLGFLIVAFNASLAAAWAEAQAGKNKAAPNLALASALIAAAWLYGKAVLLARPQAGPTARVELLQPAIDQYQKWSPDFAEEIDGVFAELLSRPRTENPALVVWPESSLPRLVEEGEGVPEAAAWSRRLGASQIVGVISREARRLYNAAVLIGPEGMVQGLYRKRQLVPFGEFVPFPWLKEYIGILNELGGIDPGEARQRFLPTPLGPAAASICYEAVFPHWIRLDASRGARIMVNITNDGWYKDTWGPYQHFQANAYRAIENRMTVIRSGNTGISAVIDPWGVILARSQLGLRTRLEVDVPAEDHFPRRSFYARHGDWFGLACLAATLLLIAL